MAELRNGESGAAQAKGADRWDGEVNSEQADPGQAQDVAEELLEGVTGDDPLDSASPLDSRRAGAGPEDPPDMIDQMGEMLRTGVIDYDAYVGEPRHDDEEDSYGDVEERDAGTGTLRDEVAADVPGDEDPLADMASEGDGDGEEPLVDL